MEKSQAIKLIEEVFDSRFSEEKFSLLCTNLLNDFNKAKATPVQAGNYVYEPYRNHIKSFRRIGQYTDPKGEVIDILSVKVHDGFKIERTRTGLRNFAIEYLKRKEDRDTLLVAFHSDESTEWRFSFIKLEYKTVKDEKGRIKARQEATSAKRYSFLVGEHEPCHTAKRQLLPLLLETTNNPSIYEIEQCFNIERVTKEFFDQYKTLFVSLQEHLDTIVEKDKKIANDFKEKKIETTAFAKKLLGQIVFLYFIQKKGWLGVPKDKGFGQGEKRFLKNLFDKAAKKGENFFNEYLEPLFYEALAVQRVSAGDASYYKRFDCKIPFLNGGLFEPIKDYDWQNTDINIPNEVFSNTTVTKEGDSGTGILDVFDRYNFTVKEDEPLEKEVAVDPEMLGKVFENLLEVKDRKSKGAFYTPREIVHYMCEESLVNYLDTALNTTKEIKVSKDDIYAFIKNSHLVVEDNRKEKSSFTWKLPQSIQIHAALFDKALAEIKVCDPAIGSGAFPVGMLTEIVKARTALTPYIKTKDDSDERTPYHLKRECIQNSLYGVDIEESAIDIAKLRLWLSLVVDEDDIQSIEPLPNLDYKIVCGNSLLGLPDGLMVKDGFENEIEIEELKREYFKLTNHDAKKRLKKTIDKKFRDMLESMRKFSAKDIPDISFDFKTHFSEVWHGRGGFDVVIGNPPYGRYTGVSDIDKERFIESGIYGKTSDLSEFFIRRVLNSLLKKEGVLTFIVPKGLSYVKSWESIREIFLNKFNMLTLVDAGKSFENVLYEALIFVLKSSLVDGKTFKSGCLKDGYIEESNADRDYLRQNIFIFGLPENKLNIYKKIDKCSVPVSKYMDYWYGKGGLTPHVNTLGNGVPVLTGKEIQRYSIRLKNDNKWFIDDKYLNDNDRIRTKKKKVVVQDIIAHIENPVPHLKITAAIDLNQQLCFNTVMCFSEKGELKNESLVALLNSTTINFYYYYFIYNQAIRTMHFMPGYADVCPVSKKIFDVQDIITSSVAKLTNKISGNKEKNYSSEIIGLSCEIDARVAHLYNLTESEYQLILEGTEDTFRITALNFFRDIEKGILK